MTDSSTTRLILVRHGAVDAAWRDRVYGCLDVPLSEEGRGEARTAAARLAEAELAAVVSSGLARAEFGAALLRADRALERQDDFDLREIDRGAWAGRPLADLERDEPGAWRAWHERPATNRAPDGESLADLAVRVRPRFDAWAARHPGASVAIVSHSWVVRVAVCTVLDVSLDQAPRFDVTTGGVVVIEWPVDRASGLRPTLSGFVTDRPPPAGAAWFRGSHRAR